MVFRSLDILFIYEMNILRMKQIYRNIEKKNIYIYILCNILLVLYMTI